MQSVEELHKEFLGKLRDAILEYYYEDDMGILEGGSPMHPEVRTALEVALHAISRVEDSDHIQHCGWEECNKERASLGKAFTPYCANNYNQFKKWEL